MLYPARPGGWTPKAQARWIWGLCAGTWVHLSLLLLWPKALEIEVPRHRPAPLQVTLVTRQAKASPPEEIRPIGPRRSLNATAARPRQPDPEPPADPSAAARAPDRPIAGDKLAEIKAALWGDAPPRRREPTFAVDREALGIPPLPVPGDTAEPPPQPNGPPPESPELASYLARVEDLLLRRWMAQDLSLERRAAGGQGWVTIHYRIEADGQVRDLALDRRSGEPELDRMALATVPRRLPRPPPGLAPLRHQVRLTYRNPLLGD